MNSSPPAAVAPSFTFCIDGIGDPWSARLLTRLMADKLGLRSRCDPAGMWLTVEAKKQTPASTAEAVPSTAAAAAEHEENEPKIITEHWVDEIVRVGRLAGFELRDRVGSSFIASATKQEIAKKLAFEWRSRLATGLVFLLPAIALHYLTPMLAQGSRLIPWMIEAGLVGWAILASAWPIIYQAWLALSNLRMTPDFFAGCAILISYITALAAGWGEAGPAAPFQACAFIVISLTLQRAILWRKVDRLDGLASRLAPSHVVLQIGLLLAVIGGGIIDGSATCMLAMLIAMPALIGPLSINRLIVGHPAAGALPVLMFEVLLLAVPWISHADSVGLLSASVMIEGAFAFNLLITILYGSFIGAKPVKAAAQRAGNERRPHRVPEGDSSRIK